MNIRMAECHARIRIAGTWIALAEALGVGPLRVLAGWILEHKVEPLHRAVLEQIEAEWRDMALRRMEEV